MTIFERFIRALGLTPVDSAYQWKSKISTWVGVLQTAFGAAVVTWTQLPPEMRTEIPRSVIGWVGIGVLFFGFITPLAVNALQPKLQQPKLPDA